LGVFLGVFFAAGFFAAGFFARRFGGGFMALLTSGAAGAAGAMTSKCSGNVAVK
jgi:hypothetical protein